MGLTVGCFPRWRCFGEDFPGYSNLFRVPGVDFQASRWVWRAKVLHKRGARLRCVFQKLEAEVTAAGLCLRSTATGAADRAQVVADRLSRDAGPTLLLERRGCVDLASGHARYIRPRLIEEYSASVDGIRQDFVVTRRLDSSGRMASMELQHVL
jgi:hypothetical protein